MANDDTTTLYKALERINNHELGEGIRLIRAFLSNHPEQTFNDEMEGIERTYGYLLSFYEGGSDDPKRKEIYDDLRQKLSRFARNAIISWLMRTKSFYSDVCRRLPKSRVTDDTIKHSLESFVMDSAMLSLEPEEQRLAKSRQLHKTHFDFTQSLFCHILVSSQWTEANAAFYESLLLSPTIDLVDSQVIVSALMLATMNVMDPYKFRVLVNVYLGATDESLRQRALIGWVFALSADFKTTFEIRDMVSLALQKPGVRDELGELQKQIIFCMNAEKDNEKIQKDIMPELIKNNDIRVTRFGITEKEEDPMADILDPGTSDRAMEKLEESFQKMINMQKAGSDIYFGGFSQMKRFPFFYNVANWFYPFYLEHPDISSVVDKLKDASLLATILENGPFCDSDKYSFALAISSIISQLPANMREALSSADSYGSVVSDTDRKSPAYIRRMILQDLYRFFRLYQYRQELVNPFDEKKFVFLADPVFRGMPIRKPLLDISFFLLKQKNKRALDMLKDTFTGADEPRELLFRALYELDFNDNPGTAVTYLERLNTLQPDNRRVLTLLARAYFEDKSYKKAAETYGYLYDEDPENKNVTLNYCVALSKAGNYETSTNLLYKLTLDHPNSEPVTRVLAWTLMRAGKLEQAEALYERLLKSEDVETGDMLNRGYCQWIIGHTGAAAKLFRRFLKASEASDWSETMLEEFHKAEDFLDEHGVTNLDRHLMIDLINGFGTLPRAL